MLGNINNHIHHLFLLNVIGRRGLELVGENITSSRVVDDGLVVSHNCIIKYSSILSNKFSKHYKVSKQQNITDGLITNFDIFYFTCCFDHHRY